MCMLAITEFQEIKRYKTVYVMRTVYENSIKSPCQYNNWIIGERLTVKEQINIKVGDEVNGGVFHVFTTKKMLMDVIKSGEWAHLNVKPFKALAFGKIAYGKLMAFDGMHNGMRCAGVTSLKLIERI